MKPNLFRPRNVFAVGLVAATCAVLAFAHNKLMKTEPAAGAVLKTSPAHVEMWFEEKPDAAVTKIAVKGPAGAVDMAPVHAGSGNAVVADIKGKLADGRYTVSWQTAGDDGHMSKGDFGFSLQTAH
jgi:methionine-rich copper-binding protein CopC